MDRIRTLIVDDERLARRRVRRLLSSFPDFDVVGECASGGEALEFLQNHPVDLLFLDVQMPGTDGFGVVENLRGERPPMVVFITAFDEYALRAFEVHAIDYLLKPFDPERFQKAVGHIRGVVNTRNGKESQKLQALIEEVRQRPPSASRFAVKSTGRVFFVRQEDIDWVEAADNYVCLHVGNDTHLLRETMNSIETRLDTSRFARIHRSTIVNLDRIKELRPWFHGEYVVVLNHGTELTLSRSYRDKVLQILNA